MSLAARVIQDAADLGVALTAHTAESLLRLIEELQRWNRTYNLTAIRDPQEMLTHHLLDSLSIHAELRGVRIADVGTGAGFPGLPLACVYPEKRFTLIDSNGKKIRFVRHAIRELDLTNVDTVQARVAAITPQSPFDTVIARAFAPLPQLLEQIAALCGPDTRVVAMKGRWPQRELDELPAGWGYEESRKLAVPGLAEERCAIVLSRRLPLGR